MRWTLRDRPFEEGKDIFEEVFGGGCRIFTCVDVFIPSGFVVASGSKGRKKKS